MQERNVISGMLASWLTSFIEFVEPVKWFIVAALCLIIADFKFGIEASKEGRNYTEEPCDQAHRQQNDRLYMLDIGSYQFRGGIRSTFRDSHTPGYCPFRDIRL